MGGPSACEQCGKKFKVFAKRKKCLHCMIIVCKYCYAPHVEAKHPSAAVRFHATRARLSAHADDLVDDDVGGDVHFVSPTHKRAPRRMDYDDDILLLDNVDDIEIASDDDDEEEDEDEDDEDDDEDDDADDDERAPSLTEHDARMAQYAEFLQLQDVVATWTRREIAVKKQQRIAKRDSCYSMTAIPNVRSTREFQERELFVVSYAIVATLLVWGAYAVAYFAYVSARAALVRSMTYAA